MSKKTIARVVWCFIAFEVAWLISPFIVLGMHARARMIGSRVPDPQSGRLFPISVTRIEPIFPIHVRHHMTVYVDYASILACKVATTFFFSGLVLVGLGMTALIIWGRNRKSSRLRNS